jgi:hypothetical protein
MACCVYSELTGDRALGVSFKFTNVAASVDPNLRLVYMYHRYVYIYNIYLSMVHIRINIYIYIPMMCSASLSTFLMRSTYASRVAPECAMGKY